MDKCIIKYARAARIIFACGYLVLQGCSADRRVAGTLEQRLTHAGVLNQHYVGFVLYNLKAKKLVLSHHGNEYFTPASNTKLFTFYGGLKMIPDRVPALRYIERGDSLIFWGTGDPSLLQSRLRGTAAYHFLQHTDKKLFFSAGRYTGDFYGKGWQWDDYNDYYQAEISELPLMDNLVGFKSVNGQLAVSPLRFAAQVQADSSLRGDFSIRRDFSSNLFRKSPGAAPDGYEQQVPYKTDVATTLALLCDTLKKPVGLLNLPMPADAETLFGLPTDTVLKEMMLPSDNFIAEQLLLVYADRLGGELNAEKAIAHIEKTYLPALPDKPRWIDGSGLSRYNLFTPRDLIALLEMIYNEVNDTKRLFDLLPAGGNRGTLKNAYPHTDTPFVFGKTGSFSNNYNQSGYILTKKGQVYLFSFMNNNFVEATADVRKEMAEIITYIHEKL
jgi:D-alanyl-D-alanine carboxypeptidase/D-alanyl-D-alanine-endopeptidase (penicillin-binding protein 4)